MNVFQLIPYYECVLVNPLLEEDNDSENEEMKGSSWIDDKDLSKGTVGSLEPEEENFWEKFILKYLKPLDNDKSRETMVKTFLSVNFFRNYLFHD